MKSADRSNDSRRVIVDRNLSDWVYGWGQFIDHDSILPLQAMRSLIFQCPLTIHFLILTTPAIK